MALIQPTFLELGGMDIMSVQAAGMPTLRIRLTDNESTKPVLRVQVWDDIFETQCVGQQDVDQWFSTFLNMDVRLVR